MATVRMVERWLDVGAGIRLPMTSWLPATGERATVLALHAYGDFRLAFEEVGPWLAARGVGLHAYDQRGFGESSGHGDRHRRAPLIADLRRALRAVAPADGRPLLILGESLGGGVALAAMAEPPPVPVAGLILVEPATRRGARLGPLLSVALDGISLLWPEFGRPLERGRHPLLTEAARRRLATDRRIVRRIHADAYRNLLSVAAAASRAARRLTVPTLLLYGRGDGVIPLRLLERLERDLARMVTALRYPELPHLLLQVRGGGEVLADILAWLDHAPLPRPGSPARLRRLGPRPSALNPGEK